ncbi:uncharacterized protein LOC117181098 [Belonocnema kinseyi]|uniref:uncharacterized protein LOC117181098 n=1 Tax=Belonocnema kinseyi TaxID=2817044 RepID=UPI00143D83A6|nr:uncharacterized protein LOC117181098 [Belonocnema kinseyi]
MANLLAVKYLPLLFQPVACRLKKSCTDHSTGKENTCDKINVSPPDPKNVKEREQASVRTKTKQLHVDFFVEIENASQLRPLIAEKKNEARRNSSTVQPFMIGIIGEKKIKSYVVLNEIIYDVDSIVHAVDTCFKVFFALEAEYLIACKPVWMFIQKYIYEIELDKTYTTEESVISDFQA